MKLRRTISFLLLALYLTMAVGPVALSLSCECVAMVGHARGEASCCRHACCASRFVASEAVDCCLAAPCCDDRHSTDNALYTAADAEGDRQLRCAVIHLPASLAAECPCPAHVPALRSRPVERPAPFPADPLLGLCGFRAPPVTV